MIRKCKNLRPQTNPWHLEKGTHNTAPTRQQECNWLSLSQQDVVKLAKGTSNYITKQESNTKHPHTMGATTNNKFTALEWTAAEAIDGVGYFKTFTGHIFAIGLLSFDFYESWVPPFKVPPHKYRWCCLSILKGETFEDKLLQTRIYRPPKDWYLLLSFHVNSFNNFDFWTRGTTNPSTPNMTKKIGRYEYILFSAHNYNIHILAPLSPKLYRK